MATFSGEGFAVNKKVKKVKKRQLVLEGEDAAFIAMLFRSGFRGWDAKSDVIVRRLQAMTVPWTEGEDNQYALWKSLGSPDFKEPAHEGKKPRKASED